MFTQGQLGFITLQRPKKASCLLKRTNRKLSNVKTMKDLTVGANGVTYLKRLIENVKFVPSKTANRYLSSKNKSFL